MNTELLATIAVVLGLIATASTGWGLFMTSKVASLNALWRWKDEFVKEYNAARIADAVNVVCVEWRDTFVEKYQAARLEDARMMVSRHEFADGMARLDKHLTRLEQKLDRVLESKKSGGDEHGQD